MKLAALYESWSVPAAVLPPIPPGIARAVLAANQRGLELRFFNAILAIIGLFAKNVILIIGFAGQAKKSGLDLIEAARRSAALRLRPIVRNTLAFGAGVLPLALSADAAANRRAAIGTNAFGGTISSAFLTMFFIPLFFLLIAKLLAQKTSAV